MIAGFYRRSRVRVVRAVHGERQWKGLRILCYHRVAGGRDALTISPERFRAQMLALLESGVETVRLTEMLEPLEQPLAGRYVAITFDDGYGDLVDHAVAVLRELNLPATVFLPVSIVDGIGAYYWYRTPPSALTWSEVLKLQEEGVLDFQAHSLSHPNLLQVDDEQARAEIVAARTALESRLGRGVSCFSYPGGMYSRREIELVREAGYRCAVTADLGANPGGEPMWTLKRTVVHPVDDDVLFRAKLDGLLDSPDPVPQWLRRYKLLRPRPASGLNGGKPASRPAVVYLSSRFPFLRNTFVVRELDGLASLGLEIEVVSLLRPEPGIRHARVASWVPRVAPRPGLGRCCLDCGWWFRHHPARVLAIAAGIFRSNILTLHRPRAGVTALLLGASHARRLLGRPDTHVHAHFEIPADTAWVIHRLSGLAYSFTVHTDDGAMVPSLRRNAREASVVITPSHHTAGLIRKSAGDGVRVEVVRAALPTAEYAFRARTPPAQGAVRVLCVAGLEAFKGHEVLFRAMARPGLERVGLDVVGGGALRESLETLAERLSIRDRVRFHGARTEDEVKAFLAEAHLFVLASVVDKARRSDNIPVALMEAMASGVPVIASQLAGIPELIANGETGVLVRPGDVDELSAALRRALEGGPLLLEMAFRARRKVEREFDLSTSSATLATLLVNRRAG